MDCLPYPTYRTEGVTGTPLHAENRRSNHDDFLDNANCYGMAWHSLARSIRRVNLQVAIIQCINKGGVECNRQIFYLCVHYITIDREI